MLQIAFDPSTNPLNNNEWSFPFFECIHIAMFTMSVGTIALIDLRLLGLALPKQSPAELLKATWAWTLVGLVVVIMTGMIIFTTDPVRYYYNPAFRFKCITLLGAILYNYTIHRKTILSNVGPLVNSLVGGLSLLLWISIV